MLAVHAFDAGGAGAVGLMAIVRTLPGAPAVPVLAREGDRRSRRGLLIVVNAVRAAALAATAVAVATDAPLPVVYALVAVVAVAGLRTSPRRRPSSLSWPAHRRSFLAPTSQRRCSSTSGSSPARSGAASCWWPRHRPPCLLSWLGCSPSPSAR